MDRNNPRRRVHFDGNTTNDEQGAFSRAQSNRSDQSGWRARSNENWRNRRGYNIENEQLFSASGSSGRGSHNERSEQNRRRFQRDNAGNEQSKPNRERRNRYEQHHENDGQGRQGSTKFKNQNGDRRERLMGFKELESLINNNEMENVIFQLKNDRKGFFKLFDNENNTKDMLVLIVGILSKICDSAYNTVIIELLDRALTSRFAEELTNLILTFGVQNERDRKFNSHFWKNPEKFWENIVNICEKCHQLTPSRSYEILIKIINASLLSISNIETMLSLKVPDSVKNDLQSLQEILNKSINELEKKHKQKEIARKRNDENIEPPDDFRDIDVYPSALEVTLPHSPFLRRNIIEGPYRDVQQYLDIQYRLLREDFVRPLREGICKFMEDPRAKFDNVRIHKQVKFLNMECVNDQNCYRLQYSFNKTKKKSLKYENSKRFMYGALLCFTNDNFRTLLFGKIVNRDVQDLEKGELVVGFEEEIEIPNDLYLHNYIMVESTVYFEPYYHVLNVLKRMPFEHFPMEKYIIDVETDPTPPAYLLQRNCILLVEGHAISPWNWPDRQFCNFNESQTAAFRAALTQEFSVIQGPPGTGKTYLGLKVAHTLIQNKGLWYENSPILVICYTNHALDQFLEGILKETDNILRIGGQSKNENIQKLNIRNKRPNYNPAVAQTRRDVRESIGCIKTISGNIEIVEQNNGIIDFSVFRNVVDNFTGSYFDRAEKKDIIKWLFSDIKIQDIDGELATVANEPQFVGNYQDTPNEVDEDHNFEDEIEQIDIDEIFHDISSHLTVKHIISIKSIEDDIKDWRRALQEVEMSNMLRVDEKFYESTNIQHTILQFNAKLNFLKNNINYFNNNCVENPPDYVNLHKPNLMDVQSRWHLYYYWVGLYLKKLRENKEISVVNFRRQFKIFEELRNMEDTQLMRQCLVVGMTTTGAARLRSSLHALQSPIVIVEEAAEVLEAHIVSCLTSTCQQLILIGDHQQLKPSTANYKIETNYLLGISLFERMVINKLQLFTLNVQHRMRPEISKLICPSIYPNLQDHVSVKNRPFITGIEHCLYFIDHQEPEEKCNDNSKKNIHEAKFLIQLARHLVLNGYEPCSITILAAYLGQMFEMQKIKRQHNLLLKDVRIAVLDNYQGEESDIILLSLVRCNEEQKIGFLKIENRVCVALSRARNGLYIMGNMELLCGSSEIWPKVKNVLRDQEAIGSHLQLRCQVHTYKLTRVQKAEDFNKIPEGGCDMICDAPLTCGHNCTKFCHITDREHANYSCRKPCGKILCEDVGHICMKMCYEECGPCKYSVRRDLNCGHIVMLECHIDPEKYDCVEEVMTKLPCGHEVSKPCHRDPQTYPCSFPCEIRVEPCGHACIRTCHINNDPDHLLYKCFKPCEKPPTGCTMEGKENHTCPRRCFEECIPCEIPVKKFRATCSHVYTLSCSLNVDSFPCEKPCNKLLPCGHKCKEKCCNPCGKCNQMVEKLVDGCHHKVKVKCCEEATRNLCKQNCPRKLLCGHVCTKKCNEDCTDECQEMVDCKLLSSCGHTVTKIHCYLKNSTNKQLIQKYCREECDTKLKCTHKCTGSCGECNQSRIHKRCMEPCNAILVCNHACAVPCRQACRPCLKKCEYKCGHSKCSRNCGEPCTPCKEPCKRKCKHQRCKKKCSQLCDVNPCEEHCHKLLKCKHPCVGFCGDPCPTLCRICDKEQLTEIFLGNEDEKDARYVMLVDCGHIFESSDMLNWIQQDGNVKAKICPRCNTTIKNTQRYSEYVKKSFAELITIKKKFHGDPSENEAERRMLEVKAVRLAMREAIVLQNVSLKGVLKKLAGRLLPAKPIGKNIRRQNISKMDMQGIKTKLQIIENIVEIFEKQRIQVTKDDKSYEQVDLIANALHVIEDFVTVQEIEDFGLELDRLLRKVQFDKIKKSIHFKSMIQNKTIQLKVNIIEALLDDGKRYNNDKHIALLEHLTEINKQIVSPVNITEVERREIVGALGLQAGHWFKCQNGHLYIITECGGAMETSKCNECGASIGGRSHRLMYGSHSGEMDGAQHPAWSDQANMANYELD